MILRIIYIVVFVFMIEGIVIGQKFILREGEYMDTTNVDTSKCRDLNAYYYQVGGKYPESSLSILSQAKRFFYNLQQKFAGNGYITFRFNIDCDGHMLPKVEVLQTDDFYKKCDFSSQFLDKLFEFLQSLNKWKKIVLKDGKGVRYKAFLTFKIRNGEIVNIIP